MSYTRSPSRVPGDRRSEYALADDARAEIRKLNDALLDTGASKWRYKAPTMKSGSRASKA